MKDAIGNKLEVGSLLYWKATGQIVKVEEITEPQLTVMGEAPEVQRLKVSITFPVLPKNPNRPQEEQMVGDFVRIVDPRAQEAVESAMGRMPGKAQ